VAAPFGLALGQHSAIGIEYFQADPFQGLAAFERLGEHVQAVLIACTDTPMSLRVNKVQAVNSCKSR